MTIYERIVNDKYDSTSQFCIFGACVIRLYFERLKKVNDENFCSYSILDYLHNDLSNQFERGFVKELYPIQRDALYDYTSEMTNRSENDDTYAFLEAARDDYLRLVENLITIKENYGKHYLQTFYPIIDAILFQETEETAKEILKILLNGIEECLMKTDIRTIINYFDE